MRVTKILTVVVVLLALAAGCGSGTSSSKASSTTTPGTGGKAANVPGVGTGVTDNEIKLGVSLIDYKCIESYVDTVYVNQPKAYNAYIDNINAQGGINGRKVV